MRSNTRRIGRGLITLAIIGFAIAFSAHSRAEMKDSEIITIVTRLLSKFTVYAAACIENEPLSTRLRLTLDRWSRALTAEEEQDVMSETKRTTTEVAGLSPNQRSLWCIKSEKLIKQFEGSLE